MKTLTPATQRILLKLIFNGNICFEHSNGTYAHHFKELLQDDFEHLDSAINEGVEAGLILRNGLLENNSDHKYEHCVVLNFEEILTGDYLMEVAANEIELLRYNFRKNSRNQANFVRGFKIGKMALKLEQDGLYEERNELFKLGTEIYWSAVKSDKTKEENLKNFLVIHEKIQDVLSTLDNSYDEFKQEYTIKAWKQALSGYPLDFFPIHPRNEKCLCGSGLKFKKCCM